MIYANPALLEDDPRHRGQIRRNAPDFSADNFVGSSIRPAVRRSRMRPWRLASLTRVARTQMEIGGRTFDVVTSPIIGASGERLGSVGEWRDRTDELAAERRSTRWCWRRRRWRLSRSA